MDGENNGSKPYEQMDDLGGKPPIFGSTPKSQLNGAPWFFWFFFGKCRWNLVVDGDLLSEFLHLRFGSFLGRTKKNSRNDHVTTCDVQKPK